jgi:hypothetical protein
MTRNSGDRRKPNLVVSHEESLTDDPVAEMVRSLAFGPGAERAAPQFHDTEEIR